MNDHSMIGLAPMDQDIVRFDVYNVLAIIIKQAGRI